METPVKKTKTELTPVERKAVRLFMSILNIKRPENAMDEDTSRFSNTIKSAISITCKRYHILPDHLLQISTESFFKKFDGFDLTFDDIPFTPISIENET